MKNLALASPATSDDVRLIRYDEMCRAITECHRVDEAKDIRDKAAALEHYYTTYTEDHAVKLATTVLCAALTPLPLSAVAQPYSLLEPVLAKVSADTRAVTVGLRFVSDADGDITAVRFYRHVASAAGYSVQVWDGLDCTLLGDASLIEGQGPVPGWQVGQIFPPVPVTAGHPYIVSYHAPAGRYTVAPDYWTGRLIQSGPLRNASGEEGQAGVYSYGTSPACPVYSYRDSSYLVDALFQP